MFRIPKILVEKIQKTLRTLNYVRQTNRETKENQRDKNGKMLLLFNKVGKVIILVRSSIFVSVLQRCTWMSFYLEIYYSQGFVLSSRNYDYVTVALSPNLTCITQMCNKKRVVYCFFLGYQKASDISVQPEYHLLYLIFALKS